MNRLVLVSVGTLLLAGCGVQAVPVAPAQAPATLARAAAADQAVTAKQLIVQYLKQHYQATVGAADIEVTADKKNPSVYHFVAPWAEGGFSGLVDVQAKRVYNVDAE